MIFYTFIENKIMSIVIHVIYKIVLLFIHIVIYVGFKIRAFCMHYISKMYTFYCKLMHYSNSFMHRYMYLITTKLFM